MIAQTSLLDEISVDLFAGGGGASTGKENATGVPVTIAINHSRDAVRMHRTNHPYTEHLCEDVFDVDPVSVCRGRPVGMLWASPDCTHHSKARGGKPVQKKIRGLPWIIVRWALTVNPRVIMFENVEEIQSWGPLFTAADGKEYPDPAHKGETFDGFIAVMTAGIAPNHPALLECCEFLKIEPNGPDAQRLINGLSYDFAGRELCAADYGVPTIRNRYYGCFRCDGQPIVFPEPTHCKGGKNGLKLWRSAAEIIDWSIPCPSIFATKAEIKERYGVSSVRPLADNTLKRCIRGVDKFTIKSGKPFIVPIGYGERLGQAPRVHDIEQPVSTVVSSGKQYICTPSLMAIGQTGGGDRISGSDSPINTQVSKAETCLIAPSLIQYHQEQTEYVRGQSMVGPIMTIDGSDRYGLVSAQLTEYFGNGQPLDVGAPMHTVTAKDREALTLAQLSEFRNTDIGSSASNPLRTVASHDHQALTLAHVQKYFDGGYKGCGSEVAEPLGTVTAADHNALCLSHVIKFKGTNLGQASTDPLQTITSESGGGSYGTVFTTVERYGAASDLKYWPKIRALLNQHCGYNLADDEVILLWISGVAYFIADIGLRMLTPRELYNAMGFPPDYIIEVDYLGKAYSKTAQVARCGNAVCPPVAGALIAANLPEYAVTYITTMAQLNDMVAI